MVDKEGEDMKERIVRNLLNLMLNLAGNDFYGKLIITFEKGKVVHAVKEESLKPGINF